MNKTVWQRWLEPVGTLFAAGLGWGMAYGLVVGLKIVVDSITFSWAKASLPVILSFVLMSGLLSALISLPLGLLLGVIGGLLQKHFDQVVLSGAYAGLLSVVFMQLILMGRADRILAGFLSVGLLVMVSGGIYLLGRVWQLRGRPWRRLSGRLVMGGVWVLLLVVTTVLALGRGWTQGGGALDRPAGDIGRPNVVLLTIDALRADHVGAYGYQGNTSPHIDALAQQGVLYERAVAQSSWTFPSFASMMTSLHPSELDIPGEERTMDELSRVHLDGMRVTLAEGFQAVGYQTQGIVTNYWLSPVFGFAQGFEGYQQMYALPHSFDRLDEVALIQLLQEFWPAGFHWMRERYERIWGPADDGWDTEAAVVNHYVLKWLEEEAREPFFLWVHYIDPHAPYDPPESHMPQVTSVSPQRLAFLRVILEELLDGTARIRLVDRQVLIDLYDAEIRVVDEAIGEVVDMLEQLGLGEQTIIVVTSDHGEEFQEHGYFDHGFNLYGEVIEIPLLVSGAERWIGPARVVTPTVAAIDLMPTLLALGGAAVPAEAEGLDLFAAEEQGILASRQYVYSEGLIFRAELKTIQDNRYKLILDPHSGEIELYDLFVDPGERNNLASEEPGIVQRLHHEILAWMAHNVEVASTLPRSGADSAQLDPALKEGLREGGY